MNHPRPFILRLPRNRKGPFTKAARDQGLKLADWCIQTLDKASQTTANVRDLPGT